MPTLAPRERLTRAFNQLDRDRAPVICPGGMMNAAIVEVMEQTGNTLPAAHHDGALMAALANDVANLTGFENFGLPFCMTIEAEAFGSEIDYGTLKCEPKIAKEIFPSAKTARLDKRGAIVNHKRAAAVISAIDRLAKSQPEIPTIGSITGPMSIAASIVDPMTFLKELRTAKDDAHRVLDYVTEELIAYARLLADNGAAAISIADPTATGEILGPKLFAEYAVPYLNRVIAAINALGKPVIVHICGDMKAVKKPLADLRGEALSVDAMVNLRDLKNEVGIKTTMGNLSTYTLEFGNPEKVAAATEVLLRQNIDILAPACGLSTSTPLANIRAFTDTIKN
jgi:[methyl-Co(III) methanol-specific corrinoid protein]:coenzyme M methyltransferase